MMNGMTHPAMSAINSMVTDDRDFDATLTGMDNDHGGGNSFCNGGGMVMYMDGFRLSLTGNQPCLNLYFPGWTLDTRTKFVLAMLGVFSLAIATEGVSKLRFRVDHKQRLLITSLHALQALMGYVLMLATMTFSVEFLSCVVVGLGVGYSVFYDDAHTHVTTNPCCNFMQSRADAGFDHDDDDKADQTIMITGEA